jgi:predicted nucleic acid-binding protein
VKYLVDANVLSEPTRQEPVESAVEWLVRHEGEICVNPIILGELEFGVLRLPAGKRREKLLSWFRAGKEKLPLLKMDAETARHWANLLAKLQHEGRAMPIKDSLIAATALQHNLTIGTRNTRDFQYAGVRLENPFSDEPRP